MCPVKNKAANIIDFVEYNVDDNWKGWLAVSKLKPLSLFISLFLMLKKAFDNIKIEKWKVKAVLAQQ